MAATTVPGPLIPDSEPWYSRISFSFMNKLVDKGLRQTLDYEDLYDIPEHLRYEKMFPKFQAMYQEKRKANPKYPIGSAIVRFLRPQLLHQAGLVILACIFDLSVPLQIKFFIQWISDPVATWWLGLVWAAGICIAYTLKLNLGRRGWHVTANLSYSIGVIIRGAIFAKLTSVSREGLANINVGLITMVMNHDAMKLQILPRPMNFLYVLPLVSVAGFLYFYFYFNWMAVVFPALALLWVGAVLLITKIVYKHLQQILVYSDKRGKLVTESLGFIKNIKFECWEENILSQLAGYRRLETSSLSKYFFWRNLMVGFTENFSPAFILCFVSFYTAFYSSISLDQTYFLISLSSMLMMPLTAFVSFVDAMTSSKVALQRVDRLLGIPERPHLPTNKELPVGTIHLVGVSAGWNSKEISDYFQKKEDSSATCLKDLQLEFLPGQMYAVVGKVGSGKSALLNCILGDMSIKCGEVKRNGSIAYVSQSPFLLNATIRENILFGKEFDPDRYKTTVIKCRLLEDLKILAAGDMTEIGERGVNLSGGQKQRISLARAIYANKEIYLIDDTLSALDPQVATRVFQDVILGELRANKKTVVLVTHSLSCLKDCDETILLDNGKVTLKGSYDQVCQHELYMRYSTNAASKQEAPKEVLNPAEEAAVPQEATSTAAEDKPHEQHKQASFESEWSDLSDLIDPKHKSADKDNKGKLTKQEQRQQGRVAGVVYSKYMQNFGPCILVISVLFFLGFIALKNFSDYWLGYWASGHWSLSAIEYRFTYVGLVLGMFLILLLRSVVLSVGMNNFGIKINQAMMNKVFRRPMSFFNSTPVGVIINRCTKEQLDTDLIFNVFLSMGLSNAARMLSVVVVLCITLPFMLVVFVVAILILVRILNKATIVSSDVKRITQVSTAPVISQVAEMYQGMQIFKGYDKLDSAVANFTSKMNRMLKSDLADRYLENWMFWRIEAVACGLLACTAFFIYLVKQADISVFNNPNSLSLAITWIASSGDLIGFCLMTFAEFMKGMSSIERMFEVADSPDVEAARNDPQPPKDWPQTSRLDIRNLSLRYRTDLPFVLQNVTVSVEPREKIGIIGRTGCGKSSLILALKRILEIETNQVDEHVLVRGEKMPSEQGCISLDGVDISKVGLKQARGATTLIPQDPFVMSGTVRSNIDKFQQHTDAEVLEVLQKTKLIDSLREKVPATQKNSNYAEVTSSTDPIINLEIESGGSNLSQGQRQLLGIARALIKKPKVLLMDEATASIDSKTDGIIQQVLREEFKDSTIITIAHRINTIIQYDKILALDAGKVVEFGKPAELLLKEESFLSRMVKQSGTAHHQQMLSLAENK